MEDILNQIFFGNTVLAYAKALGIFVLCIVVVKIFRAIILKRLKKWAERTKTDFDDFIIVGIQKSIVPILYYGAFYFAIETLSLSGTVDSIIYVLSIFVLTFFAIRLITSTLDFSIVSYTSKQEEDKKAKQLKSISALARIVIWGIGLVFLLDNLGLDISAIVAGLGIGGIAVAIAAQAILGDLFSYFVIFFDRPFELGDFIIVDDKTGTVEHIGIKTTRIRALSGEQLVMSNTDLTSSRVHNYKKLQRRRVVFQLGVIYQTSAEKLKIIPELVKQIIVATPDTEFDRGHFKVYGDFSLNFEFVYYVLSSDYATYMDIQQAINIEIFNKFEKEGIEFAYPTQLVYMDKIDSDNTGNRNAA
ncbi:MAG: mechanosensitive ion channel family protein [Ignavibacteriaceae bacterium]